MKNVLWLLFLSLISFANANAEDTYGVGDVLYYWKNSSFIAQVVEREETRITACHPIDKSLTLTRETRVTAGGLSRSTVRVRVGDTFLLYTKDGPSRIVILESIKNCFGEFRTIDSLNSR